MAHFAAAPSQPSEPPHPDIPARPSYPSFAGDCKVPSIARNADKNRTCVKGCCAGDGCECEAGFGGALCEYKMTCVRRSLAGAGQAARPPWSSCRTEFTDGYRVDCTCEHPGMMAVIMTRILPKTAVEVVSQGLQPPASMVSFLIPCGVLRQPARVELRPPCTPHQLTRPSRGQSSTQSQWSSPFAPTGRALCTR